MDEQIEMTKSISIVTSELINLVYQGCKSDVVFNLD